MPKGFSKFSQRRPVGRKSVSASAAQTAPEPIAEQAIKSIIFNSGI
jgi:hypothetical protein